MKRTRQQLKFLRYTHHIWCGATARLFHKPLSVIRGRSERLFHELSSITRGVTKSRGRALCNISCHVCRSSYRLPWNFATWYWPRGAMTVCTQHNVVCTTAFLFSCSTFCFFLRSYTSGVRCWPVRGLLEWKTRNLRQNVLRITVCDKQSSLSDSVFCPYQLKPPATITHEARRHGCARAWSLCVSNIKFNTHKHGSHQSLGLA